MTIFDDNFWWQFWQFWQSLTIFDKFDNFTSFETILKRQSSRLVTFETLITLLTIENNNISMIFAEEKKERKRWGRVELGQLGTSWSSKGNIRQRRMSPSARHKQSLVQQEVSWLSAVEICISSEAQPPRKSLFEDRNLLKMISCLWCVYVWVSCWFRPQLVMRMPPGSICYLFPTLATQHYSCVCK